MRKLTRSLKPAGVVNTVSNASPSAREMRAYVKLKIVLPKRFIAYADLPPQHNEGAASNELMQLLVWLQAVQPVAMN